MSQSAAATQTIVDDKNAVYKRITLRLIPFIFICYLFNYLDRVNVGFAKLQMLDACLGSISNSTIFSKI